MNGNQLIMCLESVFRIERRIFKPTREVFHKMWHLRWRWKDDGGPCDSSLRHGILSGEIWLASLQDELVQLTHLEGGQRMIPFGHVIHPLESMMMIYGFQVISQWLSSQTFSSIGMALLPPS